MPLRLHRFSALLLLGLSCNSQQAIHLSGSLAVSPAALDFHVVTIGKTAVLPVSLSSQTSTAIVVHSLTLTGTGAAAFSVSSNPGTVSGQTSVMVTFAPTTATTYAATLSVASSDPDHPTVAVALSGVGATEEIQVRVQVVDGGVGVVPPDGGLAIAFGLDTWAAGPATWPNILIENLGGASAQLTGVTLSSDAGAFFFPTVPTVPQTISSQQTRVLPIAFGVPLDNDLQQSQLTATLTLTFDDPHTPTVTIPLSGQITLAQPPSVCAGILSAQELDGSIETPPAFGNLVPVEPGSQVQLSAYSSDLADAGPDSCTFDSSFGRGSLSYQWSVTTAPAGSTAMPATPAAPRTLFVPDLVGHYVIMLSATDPNGRAGVAAAPAANQVAFDAAPLEDLTVLALWPGFPGVDLDLHFVRPGSSPFNATGDVCALNAGNSHDWSAGDPTGDPHYSGDDTGNGNLQESAWINHPAESCLADGGCTFGLWVHYYQDNRSLVSAASCTLPGCVEGQGCGCPSEQACEPNLGGSGACGAEVQPEAQVYFKGQITPALEVPIPLEALLLPSPCYLWHAAEVVWRGDAGMALAVGDGGAETYWGDHTDETRQCAENDGGWAMRLPPTYP